MPESLKKLIERLEREGFYGEIVIKFENGQPKLCTKIKENIKL